MTRIDTDVLIVVGGPAGLYAGLELSRAGYRVDLVEEHADIGAPVHCTGVLARDAFDTFDRPVCSILNELTTVQFVSPSGVVVPYSTQTVEAVVIDRHRFDRQLADEARGAGLRIRTARVTAIEPADATVGPRAGRSVTHPSAVRVTAGTATYHARSVILACGASYGLQRQLGLGLPGLFLHSAQAELPADRLGDVEVYFGSQVAPRGFAWAVPVQRADRPHVRIGVMCHGDAARRFHALVERLRPRWRIEAENLAPRQKILPLGPVDRTYTDRVIVVGDAAGLVKPTTGGGIYYSLLSARLAADVLGPALAADDLRHERLSAYEVAWRRKLGSELRWQTLLRRVAERLPDREIDRLFDLATTDGLMPLLRRTARFNEHRAFIVALLKHPPARRVLFRAAFA